MIPSVNDFYDFLGLEHTKQGEILGWSDSSGIYWIDFNHYRIHYDNDNLKCFMLECCDLTAPIPDFLEDKWGLE